MTRYNTAKDAGKNLNGFLRDEVGGGLVFATATFTHSYHERDYMTGEPTFDTSYKKTIQAKSGFILSEQTGYPLTTLSNNSALLLTYGLNIRFINWKQEAKIINGKSREYGITNTDMSVPVSLDYKSGGEAMLDRSKRTCFTVGAGIEPMLISGSWGVQVGSTVFRVFPFAKMEFGFVTGIAAFKLRATGTIGTFNYFSRDDMAEEYGNSNITSDISIVGKNQFALTLLIMPMVRKWEDAAWYR